MMSVPPNGELKLKVVGGRDLTPQMVSAWSRIVAENPGLCSPFFSPEYTLTLAAALPQVRVGVAEQLGEPVAFLPFEPGGFRMGRRLRLCDYQGLIARPGFEVDMAWFVRRCGLWAWEFDHLLAAQPQFQPFHRRHTESPIVDLSLGYDEYLEGRRRAGRMEFLKRVMSKMRKLEREAGGLRFEIHVEDTAVLRQLLTWRAARYESRHSLELLESVLSRLLAKQTPQLKGTLSVLYAGSEVAAVHFGLRSESTWHWWFPAYNPGFEKFSPGLLLILKMAEHAAPAGVRILDFGKGDQDYKRHLMNGAIPLAEGSVEASSWLARARKAGRDSKSWLRGKPLLFNPARGLARAVRRLAGRA